MRLGGERLSLNATSYTGRGGSRGKHMCEPQFSVTPKSRGVWKQSGAAPRSGLLSDTTSDLWKCPSSLETPPERGGLTLYENVTNDQTVQD